MSRCDYDATPIPNYHNARAISAGELAKWLDTLAGQIHETPRMIADLGCGTGRFSGPLADRFCARVLAIDPSTRMLAQASPHPGVSFVRARCERLPLPNTLLDFSFMSLAWHHISDRASAAREIARTLKKGALFAMRTSTLEGLDTCIYLRFFPEAFRILAPTLPTRRSPLPELAQAGLQLIHHEILPQQTDVTLADSVNRVAQRAYSDLVRISDEAFERGLKRMRELVTESASTAAPPEDLDLFIFKK